MKKQTSEDFKQLCVVRYTFAGDVHVNRSKNAYPLRPTRVRGSQKRIASTTSTDYDGAGVRPLFFTLAVRLSRWWPRFSFISTLPYASTWISFCAGIAAHSSGSPI